MQQADSSYIPSLGMIWGGKAISHRIGKSVRQTFYLLETGQIPARKVGDQWVTTEKALQALADSIAAREVA